MLCTAPWTVGQIDNTLTELTHSEPMRRWLQHEPSHVLAHLDAMDAAAGAPSGGGTVPPDGPTTPQRAAWANDLKYHLEVGKWTIVLTTLLVVVVLPIVHVPVLFGAYYPLVASGTILFFAMFVTEASIVCARDQHGGPPRGCCRGGACAAAWRACRVLAVVARTALAAFAVVCLILLMAAT